MMGWMLLLVPDAMSHLLHLFIIEEQSVDSNQINDIQIQQSLLEGVKAEIEKKGPLQ